MDKKINIYYWAIAMLVQEQVIFCHYLSSC